MTTVRRSLPALVTAVFLSACNGAGATAPLSSASFEGQLSHSGSQVLAGRTASAYPMVPDVRPDKCGTTKTYAYNDNGGEFKLPSCAGALQSGYLTYGSVDAPPSETISFSTWSSNPDPSQCLSISGKTVVLWILMETDGDFGRVQSTKKKSVLKNPAFQQYSVFSLFQSNSASGTMFWEGLGAPTHGTLKFESPWNLYANFEHGLTCLEIVAGK